jgi:hypothetical protein
MKNARFGVPPALVLSVACALIVLDLYAFATGLPLKLSFAYLSVIIALAGYAIYISEMCAPDPQHAVRPHPLSWTGFGFLTGAGWLIQVSQGAEAGSWCLGVTAAACLLIAGVSFAKFDRQEWELDRWSVGAALAGIALFFVSFATRSEPGWALGSAVCATLADLAFYYPTIKKARRTPKEESAINFAFNSAKCIPAYLALDNRIWATTFYLWMLFIVNGGFACYLIYRNWEPSKLRSH